MCVCVCVCVCGSLGKLLPFSINHFAQELYLFHILSTMLRNKASWAFYGIKIFMTLVTPPEIWKRQGVLLAIHTGRYYPKTSECLGANP